MMSVREANSSIVGEESSTAGMRTGTLSQLFKGKLDKLRHDLELETPAPEEKRHDEEEKMKNETHEHDDGDGISSDDDDDINLSSSSSSSECSTPFVTSREPSAAAVSPPTKPSFDPLAASVASSTKPSCEPLPAACASSSQTLQSPPKPDTNDNFAAAKTEPPKVAVVEANVAGTSKGVTCPPVQSQTDKPRECLVVNAHSYQVLNMLGKGGSSKVYQVYDERSERCLAVKVVDLSDADDIVRRSFEKEIDLLKKLQKSDKVVQLVESQLVEETNKLYVVMEKGDTDLSTFLKGKRSENLTDKLIAYYWMEMLKAVQVVHDNDIVHSDLKPSNFLLVGGNLKLIDFGIASSVPSNKTSVTLDCQMGTLNYMSPEAINNAAPGTSGDTKFKIPLKSDVWSLGCILYNMVYGRTPFQHITNTYTKMMAIVDKKAKIQYKPGPDKQLIDVMQSCLQRDHRNRPSIKDLLSHPYLENTRREESAPKKTHLNLNERDLLSLGASLGQNTPRTNARLLKSFFGQNAV